MSGFSEHWLTLREPLDTRSRAHPLAADLSAWCAGIEPLRILDLATGTGANLRYLAPLLGGTQEWLLTDNDPQLLQALPASMRAWARDRGYTANADATAVAGPGFSVRMTPLLLDLAAAPERLPCRDRDLITGSALLDLVSPAWLRVVAEQCVAAGAANLFALSYDGRVDFSPSAPEDEQVRELVNRHQRGDKGFGPALGPTSAETAAGLFVSLGYRPILQRSDWRITTDERALQEALLAGWVQAAREVAPDRAERLGEWHCRRRALIAGGRSRLVIGHLDLLALPG